MDGSFMDLEAEAIEGEVDEYWRDLYKIQKIFNNKMKKLNVMQLSIIWVNLTYFSIQNNKQLRIALLTAILFIHISLNGKNWNASARNANGTPMRMHPRKNPFHNLNHPLLLWSAKLCKIK